MDVKSKKPFRQRIRREAREVFNELDENTKLLYTSEQCSMCGAHLTIRQLNRVIIEGVPPICLKDYKQMMGQMQELSSLMGQLRLF